MTTNFTQDKLRQIFKSRNILIDIMEHRGYDTEDHKGFSITDIGIMAEENQLDMLFRRPAVVDTTDTTDTTDPSIATGDKVYVRYNVTSTIRRPNIVNDLVEDIYNIDEVLGKSDELLIVTTEDANDTITSLMTKIWFQDKIYINIVNIARLQFNILKHELVPPHTILTQAEREAVMVKYSIQDTKYMPTISRYDPVSCAIGMRPGQVCKIVRTSKTSITSDYFRVCV